MPVYWHPRGRSGDRRGSFAEEDQRPVGFLRCLFPALLALLLVIPDHAVVLTAVESLMIGPQAAVILIHQDQAARSHDLHHRLAAVAVLELEQAHRIGTTACPVSPSRRLMRSSTATTAITTCANPTKGCGRTPLAEANPTSHQSSAQTAPMMSK